MKLLNDLAKLKAGLLFFLFANFSVINASEPVGDTAQDIQPDLTGRQIMDKTTEVKQGDNVVQEVTMIIVDDRGNEKEQRSKSYRKKMADKNETRSIMFFTYPAMIKDTGFLTYDYEDSDKNDRRWMYLPKTRKTRRIAAKDKRLSFMKSDFSHADMSLRNLDDYNYTLLGEETVHGQSVWVVESIPKSEQNISENGYTKSVFYITQDTNIIIRSVNHLKKGKRIKTMNVPILEQVGDYWVFKEVTMETSKSGHMLSKTTLRVDSILFDQKIKDSMFSLHSLERGL